MNQITSKFDTLVADWEGGKPVKVLICPMIIGGREDPFNNKKRLSSASYGELSEQEAKDFVKEIRVGQKEVAPNIEDGVDYNLIVIVKGEGFSESGNVVRCRLLKDKLAIFVQSQGQEYPVILPVKCFDLVNKAVVHSVD